jgi:hypothetical protein
MGKLKDYTIEDSACEVAKEMVPGRMLPGWKVCNKMRSKLKHHGVSSRPLDTTCLARFREVKPLFNIISIQGKSEYTKEVTE